MTRRHTSTRARGHERPRCPRAFTLVELIVVIIILSIAGAMIAPRLVRRDQRQGERVAQQCAELLRAATTRASISADAIAIEHDERAGVLRVLSPVRSEGFTQSWAERRRWRVDPLIPPVTLDPLAIDEFLVDSRRSRDGWAILGPAGASTISLTLRAHDAARSASGSASGNASDRAQVWRILADTSSSIVQLVEGANAAPPSSIIDLDAAGLRDTPW